MAISIEQAKGALSGLQDVFFGVQEATKSCVAVFASMDKSVNSLTNAVKEFTAAVESNARMFKTIGGSIRDYKDAIDSLSRTEMLSNVQGDRMLNVLLKVKTVRASELPLLQQHAERLSKITQNENQQAAMADKLARAYEKMGIKQVNEYLSGTVDEMVALQYAGEEAYSVLSQMKNPIDLDPNIRAWKELTASYQNATIELQRAFLPITRELVGYLKDASEGVRDFSAGVRSLTENHPVLAKTFALLVGIGTTVTSLLTVATAFKGIGGLAGILGGTGVAGALASVAAPLAAVVGLLGVGYGIYKLFQHKGAKVRQEERGGKSKEQYDKEQEEKKQEQEITRKYIDKYGPNAADSMRQLDQLKMRIEQIKEITEQDIQASSKMKELYSTFALDAHSATIELQRQNVMLEKQLPSHREAARFLKERMDAAKDETTRQIYSNQLSQIQAAILEKEVQIQKNKNEEATKNIEIAKKWNEVSVSYYEAQKDLSNELRMGLGASFQSQKELMNARAESVKLAEQEVQALKMRFNQETSAVAREQLKYQIMERTANMMKMQVQYAREFNQLRTGYIDALGTASLGGIQSEFDTDKDSGLVWYQGKAGGARGHSLVGGVGGNVSGLERPSYSPSYHGMMTQGGGDMGSQYWQAYGQEKALVQKIQEKNPNIGWDIYSSPHGAPSANDVTSQGMVYANDQHGQMNLNMGMNQTYGGGNSMGVKSQNGMVSYTGMSTPQVQISTGQMTVGPSSPVSQQAVSTFASAFNVSGDLNVAGSLFVKGQTVSSQPSVPNTSTMNNMQSVGNSAVFANNTMISQANTPSVTQPQAPAVAPRPSASQNAPVGVSLDDSSTSSSLTFKSAKNKIVTSTSAQPTESMKPIRPIAIPNPANSANQVIPVAAPQTASFATSQKLQPNGAQSTSKAHFDINGGPVFNATYGNGGMPSAPQPEVYPKMKGEIENADLPSVNLKRYAMNSNLVGIDTDLDVNGRLVDEANRYKKEADKRQSDGDFLGATYFRMNSMKMLDDAGLFAAKERLSRLRSDGKEEEVQKEVSIYNEAVKSGLPNPYEWTGHMRPEAKTAAENWRKKQMAERNEKKPVRTYHTGGIVPMGSGGPVPTLLLSGETIRTKPQERKLQDTLTQTTRTSQTHITHNERTFNQADKVHVFNAGGVVPSIGKPEVPALLFGGETVRTAKQEAAIQKRIEQTPAVNATKNSFSAEVNAKPERYAGVGQVRKYHDGGSVPFTGDQTIPSLLLSGETVRTPQQESALQKDLRNAGVGNALTNTSSMFVNPIVPKSTLSQAARFVQGGEKIRTPQQQIEMQKSIDRRFDFRAAGSQNSHAGRLTVHHVSTCGSCMSKISEKTSVEVINNSFRSQVGYHDQGMDVI